MDDLKLSQAGLAERLGVSPPTVSRWVQGRNEPTAETYVALGNLARKPDGVYFWERAGMDVSRLPETALGTAISSMRVDLQNLKVVPAKHLSRNLGGSGSAVAIPLLGVTAYGDQVPPTQNVSLAEVEVEDVLLAPLSWCPHPEAMIGMHVAGNSMVPLIPEGSIVFVDTAVTDRDTLNRKLSVVSHRDLGFKVARFQRMQNSDVMVSANHTYPPLDVSNASKWKTCGEVLWWVCRDGHS